MVKSSLAPTSFSQLPQCRVTGGGEGKARGQPLTAPSSRPAARGPQAEGCWGPTGTGAPEPGLRPCCTPRPGERRSILPLKKLGWEVKGARPRLPCPLPSAHPAKRAFLHGHQGAAPPRAEASTHRVGRSGPWESGTGTPRLPAGRVRRDPEGKTRVKAETKGENHQFTIGNETCLLAPRWARARRREGGGGKLAPAAATPRVQGPSGLGAAR